jgi:prepilin-type N-terminal cleavage/methylation domain-containing protein/prepilin-type processing-associated H-X9-DG protein
VSGRPPQRFLCGSSEITGFTLVEVLVVIAIVGVLAMAAFPYLQNAGQQGKLATSTNRLRALGVAMQNFLNDHQAWPSAAGGGAQRHWRQALVMGGYLGDTDPAVLGNPESFRSHSGLNCPLQSALHPKVARLDTFAMNQNIGPQTTSQPWHGPKSQMVTISPSKVALISGGQFKSPNAFQLTLYPSAAASARPMAVYQGKANILFGDGHVDLLALDEIPTSSAGTNTAGSLFWNGR